MEWTLKKFDELSPAELYDIIRLRNEVFVVEQNCVFQDADNKDPQCWHCQGRENGELLAYTRIVPAGESYAEPSIGRVVTSPRARRKGLGKELMERSTSYLYTLFGRGPIRIGAQLYLLEFYRSLGFEPEGDVYLEDDIEHIEMVKA